MFVPCTCSCKALQSFNQPFLLSGLDLSCVFRGNCLGLVLSEKIIKDLGESYISLDEIFHYILRVVISYMPCFEILCDVLLIPMLNICLLLLNLQLLKLIQLYFEINLIIQLLLVFKNKRLSKLGFSLQFLQATIFKEQRSLQSILLFLFISVFDCS